VFDWDDARFFLAIARARSLSAAGRGLRVQQSTVGRRLAGLEGALGARLFDRTPDGYLCTSAGEALLRHAERMEDEVLSAERALLGREAQIAGLVRVTTSQAFGNDLVVPLLARLHDEHPQILIEFIADNANLSLTKREADLAMRFARPAQPGLLVRRLCRVVTGLYASHDYLKRRGRAHEGDLTGHQLVDYDDSYAYKAAITWFRQRTRGARPVVRLNTTHGHASAIAAGLGVGPLPCWMGDAIPTLARVLPEHSLDQEVWLVLHRDLRHVARMRAVCEFFVRELKRAAPRLEGRAARPATSRAARPAAPRR
jgi:DNA-binding transcriptional LysR family regulator